MILVLFVGFGAVARLPQSLLTTLFPAFERSPVLAFIDVHSPLAYNLVAGEVLELADRHDLGSCAR
jgi:hypothetical protein